MSLEINQFFPSLFTPYFLISQSISCFLSFHIATIDGYSLTLCYLEFDYILNLAYTMIIYFKLAEGEELHRALLRIERILLSTNSHSCYRQELCASVFIFCFSTKKTRYAQKIRKIFLSIVDSSHCTNVSMLKTIGSHTY